MKLIEGCVCVDEETCPYCGHELNCYQILDYSDEVSSMVECPHCEKEIIIEQHMTITYAVSKPEPAEEDQG